MAIKNGNILMQTLQCHRQLMTEGIIPSGSIYLKFPQHLVFWRRYQMALSLTEGGHSALDFGCGNGALLPSLSIRFNKVYGVDLLSPQLERAEITCQRFGVNNVMLSQVADGSELACFRQLSFDSIFALDVLEHVPHLTNMSEEIARILKPGGRLIVSLPTENSTYKLAQIVTRSRPEESGHVNGPSSVIESLNKHFQLRKEFNLLFLFRILLYQN